MQRLFAATIVCCLTVASAARAGEFNEVLSIGDPAPVWKDLPGVDGRTHALSDLSDSPYVLVVFTCVSCPTAVDYEERIQQLANKHQAQLRVVAICVNHTPKDELPALKERALEKKFTFDYLYDESQQIAKDFGAVFTPEFYLLDRERRVIYMGALDDQTNAALVQRHYVEEALAAHAAGQSVATAEVIARGCRVRYLRERRPPRPVK